MLEFFTSPIGIAVISLVSSIVGALIVIVGNGIIESKKHKFVVKDELRKIKVNTYLQMLSIINVLIITKRNLNTIEQEYPTNQDKTLHINSETREYIFDAIKSYDNIIHDAMPSIAVYVETDIREQFINLLSRLQIVSSSELSFDEESMLNFNEKYGIAIFEDVVRNKIEELENRG